MALDPNSVQYQTFLILTAIYLIVKVLLTLYLLKRVLDKKRESGKINIDFMFGMLLLFISLIVSRIFFINFDFYLTQFDVTTYHLPQNVWFWKWGMFISAFGTGLLIFILDKKALKFKFKGILAYITILGGVIILLYPVSTAFDFQAMSAVSILSNAGTLLIPIIFIYLGTKIPGLRKTAFLIVAGFIIYATGALLVNDAILNLFRLALGAEIHTFIFFLHITFKMVGLIIISYSVTRFNI